MIKKMYFLTVLLCVCISTPFSIFAQSCDGLTLTSGNGSLTVGNITASWATVQLFDAHWIPVGTEQQINSPSGSLAVAEGTYASVKVRQYNAADKWTPICEKNFSNIVVIPSSGICTTPGAISKRCNNDGTVTLFSVTDAGGPGTGAIEYRWVSADNCNWTNMAVYNTSTNSLTVNTPTNENIVYKREARRAGCTDWVATGCVEINVLECSNVGPGGNDVCGNPTAYIIGGNGKITISGISTSAAIIQIFNSNWQPVYNQQIASNTVTIPNLSAGTYNVKITVLSQGGIWPAVCEKQINVVVSGGNIDICDNVTEGGAISKTCDNGKITLSGTTPTGGSGNLEYMWLSSTTGCPKFVSEAIPGANAATYTVGSVSTTTSFVRCTKRANCTDWTKGESNCITINPNECSVINNCTITDGGSISKACSNGKIVISGTAPTGGNGNFEYLWLSSTTGCPKLVSEAITGANGSSLTIDSVTKTTHFVRCVRNVNCTDWLIDPSKCITVNRNECPNDNGNGNNGNDDICNNTNAHIAGNSGKIVLTGISSGFASVQIFNSSWVSIFNQQVTSNSVTIPNLPAGTYHVKIAVLGVGGTWPAICTKDIDITVDGGGTTNNCTITEGGAISKACSNGKIVISGTAPTGGNGNFEYLWLSSTTGCPKLVSEAITGANGSSLTIDSVTKTTHFVRCVRNVNCTDWLIDPSKCITVNRNECPNDNGNGNNGNDDICNNTNAHIAGNSGKIVLTGISSGFAAVQIFNSSWVSIFNQQVTSNSVTIPNLPAGTYHVKIAVLGVGGTWPAICTKDIDITVDGGSATNDCTVTDGGSISKACNNGKIVISGTAPTGGNGNFEYLWLSSTTGCPKLVSEAITGANGSSLTIDSVTKTTHFVRCVRNINCTDWLIDPSKCITVNRNECPNDNGNGNNGNDDICNNTNAHIAGNSGKIVLTGISSGFAAVQIFNSSWVSIFNQQVTSNSVTIPNLPAGTYHVKIAVLGVGGTWPAICTKDIDITVDGGGTTNDCTITEGGSISKACSNGKIVISGTAPTGGNGNFEYLWLSSTTGCPKLVSEAIAGANGSSLTIDSVTKTTHFVRCVRNVNCTDWLIDPSKCITVNRNECPNDNGNGNNGNDDICNNTNAHIAGNSGKIVLTGISSGSAAVQIFNSSWVSIFNQIVTSNSVTIPNLPAGTYHVKIAVLGVGGTWPALCTKDIDITVDGGSATNDCTITEGGSISKACNNGKIVISGTAPTGGNGNFEYLWLSSTTGCPKLVSEAIAGANGSSLTIDSVTKTTHFVRCVRNVNCTDWLIDPSKCITVNRNECPNGNGNGGTTTNDCTITDGGSIL